MGSFNDISDERSCSFESSDSIKKTYVYPGRPDEDLSLNDQVFSKMISFNKDQVLTTLINANGSCIIKILLSTKNLGFILSY